MLLDELPVPITRPPTSGLAMNAAVAGIFAESVSLPFGRYAQAVFHEWTINISHAGKCAYATPMSQVTLEPGVILLTRPKTPLSWKVRDVRVTDAANNSVRQHWETTYAVFAARPHWQIWLDALPFGEDGFVWLQLTGETRRRIEQSMRQVSAVYSGGGMMREEWTLHALESVILQLFTHVAHRRSDLDQRVLNAVEFIHARFAEPLTVHDIAMAADLSVSRLTSLFGAALQMTPIVYLEQTRLTRAAEMLQYGSAPIAEIAAATGYAHPYYFARRFRQTYGHTPTEYREAARGNVIVMDG